LIFAQRLWQLAGRDIQDRKSAARNEAHVTITAGESPLKKFNRLTVAVKSNQRLGGTDGGAACERELASACGAKEVAKCELGVAGVQRVGTSVNQTASITGADRPAQLK
jgi:hypothetical protein